MSSTAETPSIEQKGSCRRSREPPWKISKECSEFKSRTPRFAPRLAESVAFRAATRPLTGQQCGESGKSKRFCNGRLPEPPQADNGGGERFAMIPEWAAGVKLLTKTAQRVDIALGSLCNARWGEERVVQASLSELASLTKIDRRHVARAIGELERAGRLQKRLRWLTELGSYEKAEYPLLARPAGEREGSGKNLPLGNGKNLPLGSSGKNLPLG